MIRSSLSLKLPDQIKNILEKLNNFNPILYGPALHQLILSPSASFTEISFLTDCFDKPALMSAGFNQDNAREDVYYCHFNNCKVTLSPIDTDIFTYMSNAALTVSSLFCLREKEKDIITIHDLSGKGISDLKQRRLAFMNPGTSNINNACDIFFVIQSCLNGFHCNFNVRQALEQVKGIHDLTAFNFMVKDQLTKLDYQGRKKYLKLFLQFDLLKKLFHIDYDYQIHKTVSNLEWKLNVPSVKFAENKMTTFAMEKNHAKQQRDYNQAKMQL